MIAGFNPSRGVNAASASDFAAVFTLFTAAVPAELADQIFFCSVLIWTGHSCTAKGLPV